MSFTEEFDEIAATQAAYVINALSKKMAMMSYELRQGGVEAHT